LTIINEDKREKEIKKAGKVRCVPFPPSSVAELSAVFEARVYFRLNISIMRVKSWRETRSINLEEKH